jgi:ssDNA-binding Zn-finger/Zn-ribbon topoisomerase 1
MPAMRPRMDAQEERNLRVPEMQEREVECAEGEVKSMTIERCPECGGELLEIYYRDLFAAFNRLPYVFCKKCDWIYKNMDETKEYKE